MPPCIYIMPPCEERTENQTWWDFFVSFWMALMARFVRKLDYRRLWENPRQEEAWLDIQDLRADALRDLATEDNKLSIYEVDEAEEVSLPRILAALAAKRDNVAKLDFVHFDFAIVGELGMAHERVPGDTFDAAVNARHLDLVQLTAKRLADFGARIRAAGKVERYQDKTVERLIRDSIDRGFLDPTRFKPGVARRIG